LGRGYDKVGAQRRQFTFRHILQLAFHKIPHTLFKRVEDAGHDAATKVEILNVEVCVARSNFKIGRRAVAPTTGRAHFQLKLGRVVLGVRVHGSRSLDVAKGAVLVAISGDAIHMNALDINIDLEIGAVHGHDIQDDIVDINIVAHATFNRHFEGKDEPFFKIDRGQPQFGALKDLVEAGPILGRQSTADGGAWVSVDTILRAVITIIFQQGVANQIVHVMVVTGQGRFHQPLEPFGSTVAIFSGRPSVLRLLLLDAAAGVLRTIIAVAVVVVDATSVHQSFGRRRRSAEW